MIFQIDKRLRQASCKFSEPFSGFTVVMVGDFQQLPPVGESETYQPNYSPGALAYNSFQNFFILHEIHIHSGQNYQD